LSIQVISFNCLLKNKAGHLISSTFSREVLNSSLIQNDILSGLSKGLQNLTKGERRSISLTAEEAYGLYEPKKIVLFPKSKLPDSIRVGEYISITSKTGHVRSYKVIQFHGDMVSLDGNHPLAGQDLIFEIETLEVREATIEEVARSANSITTQILH
jgi:FKBP-type peptidyl-prolyl cis-trans isomerase SlyD